MALIFFLVYSDSGNPVSSPLCLAVHQGIWVRLPNEEGFPYLSPHASLPGFMDFEEEEGFLSWMVERHMLHKRVLFLGVL